MAPENEFQLVKDVNRIADALENLLDVLKKQRTSSTDKAVGILGTELFKSKSIHLECSNCDMKN